MSGKDTIVAIATAAGRAGIGVVRISGSSLEDFAARLTGRTIPPRTAKLTAFLDSQGRLIDRGIALYFAAPGSYTGEDVLELQAHGGFVVLQILLQRCLELGARLAAPGEFTRRAFSNGKLDLAQAEAVVDLIEATTAQAARSAVRSLSGEFSVRIGALSEEITHLRMLAEATLDFPEEDLDSLKRDSAQARLSTVRAKLEAVLDAARQGSLMRAGLTVVLAGAPNVGKSSLLNRLAGDDVAIVTNIPGTTRDPIREQVDIDGVPVRLIDTAGIRSSSDPIEREGIERTRKVIAQADAVVEISDASASNRSETDFGLAPPTAKRIRVLNKIDLVGAPARVEKKCGLVTVWLSAKTGEGIEAFRQAIVEQAGREHASAEPAFLARERHLEALRLADAHLRSAAVEVDRLELFAEELRLAQRHLGEITGKFTADDLLGEIFSRFCIGK